MVQYKAGFKFVEGEVHAQVLEFPAAITCADSLQEARQLLALALVDVAEAALESGQPLPVPQPLQTNDSMDLEEPIYLHLSVSSKVNESPARIIAP